MLQLFYNNPKRKPPAQMHADALTEEILFHRHDLDLSLVRNGGLRVETGRCVEAGLATCSSIKM